jgi:negative regulator of flagellin synthesis FlgM
MSFTNGIGETPHPSDAGALGATVGIAGVARAGAAPRNSRLANGAAGELAMDTAKVSLAGAMISQATRGSDVRFDKVAALQQAIAAGTYSVSSASLADKLIGALLK